MTEAQWDALAAYVRVVRRHLYLEHWGVMILRAPPKDEDAIAEIHPTDGRTIATLQIGPTFWTHSPTSQRRTVTHELVHLLHYQVSNAILGGEYRQQLGQGLYDHLIGEVKLGLEYLVDAVATVIAEALPLPAIPGALEEDDPDYVRRVDPERPALSIPTIPTMGSH